VAFRSSGFAIIWRWRSSGSEDLSGNMFSRRRLGQVGCESDDANSKVYQAFLKFDGFGLRVSHECFFVHISFSTFHWWLTERFSSMTNEQ
jgi:hypothetical protein